MAVAKQEKQKIIKKYSQAKNDTGSPEIQVALLSAQIAHLQQHIKDNLHDFPAKRGLLSKIAKRRRLLRYLSAHASSRYSTLIKSLGLKK